MKVRCPYCKGMGPSCVYCNGRGFLEVLDAVEPEQNLEPRGDGEGDC